MSEARINGERVSIFLEPDLRKDCDICGGTYGLLDFLN